jgi:hypothetical protein
VPRSTRSELDLLRQEARAIELLANEADIPFENTQLYWDLSADLINLVSEIEQLQVERPSLVADDPLIVDLRRRLRLITSRLAEISDSE